MKQRIHRRPVRATVRHRFRRRPVDPSVRAELALIAEARRSA